MGPLNPILFRGLVFVAVGLLFVSVCAGPTEGDAAFVPTSAIEQIAGVPDDPAEAYQRHSRIALAEIETCMHEQGLAFERDPNILGGANFSAVSPYDDDRGWGVVEPTLTSLRIGLELESLAEPELTARLRELDPNRLREMTDDELSEWHRVLRGDGANQFDSCLEQSQATVRSLIDVDEPLNSQLSREFAAALSKDARLIAANAEWSECMMRSGYFYGSDSGVRDDLNRQMNEVLSGMNGIDDAPGVVEELEELHDFELTLGELSDECGKDRYDVRQQMRLEIAERLLAKAE